MEVVKKILKDDAFTITTAYFPQKTKDVEEKILTLAMSERYSRFNLPTAIMKAKQEMKSVRRLLPAFIGSILD